MTAEEAAKQVQRACPRGQHNVIDQSRAVTANVDATVAASRDPVTTSSTTQNYTRTVQSKKQRRGVENKDPTHYGANLVSRTSLLSLGRRYNNNNNNNIKICIAP